MLQKYVCMSRCTKYLMLNVKRCTCSNPQHFKCPAGYTPTFYSMEYLERTIREAAKEYVPRTEKTKE